MEQDEFLHYRKKTCKDRAPHLLNNGLDLLGKRLTRASEVSWLLTNSGDGASHGTRARDTMVAAMLTWERSLVEFVLAPIRKWQPDGEPKYLLTPDFLRQNICPWCFNLPWRLAEDDPTLHTLIEHRWETISRHLAHASWKEAESPRAFNVEKIVNVAAAIDRFAGALAAVTGGAQAATTIAAHVQVARTVAAEGPHDRTYIEI